MQTVSYERENNIIEKCDLISSLYRYSHYSVNRLSKRLVLWTYLFNDTHVDEKKRNSTGIAMSSAIENDIYIYWNMQYFKIKSIRQSSVFFNTFFSVHITSTLLCICSFIPLATHMRVCYYIQSEEYCMD